MSEELKTCPFCGGEVDFWTRQAYENEEYQALIIECKDCPANMEEWVYKYDKNFAENFEKKKAEMFEAWNWRTERMAKVDTRPFGDIDLHKCHHCQYYVDRSFTYCPGCGSKLDWSDDE